MRTDHTEINYRIRQLKPTLDYRNQIRLLWLHLSYIIDEGSPEEQESVRNIMGHICHHDYIPLSIAKDRVSKNHTTSEGDKDYAHMFDVAEHKHKQLLDARRSELSQQTVCTQEERDELQEIHDVIKIKGVVFDNKLSNQYEEVIGEYDSPPTIIGSEFCSMTLREWNVRVSNQYIDQNDPHEYGYDCLGRIYLREESTDTIITAPLPFMPKYFPSDKNDDNHITLEESEAIMNLVAEYALLTSKEDVITEDNNIDTQINKIIELGCLHEALFAIYHQNNISKIYDCSVPEFIGFLDNINSSTLYTLLHDDGRKVSFIRKVEAYIISTKQVAKGQLQIFNLTVALSSSEEFDISTPFDIVDLITDRLFGGYPKTLQALFPASDSFTGLDGYTVYAPHVSGTPAQKEIKKNNALKAASHSSPIREDDSSTSSPVTPVQTPKSAVKQAYETSIYLERAYLGTKENDAALEPVDRSNLVKDPLPPSRGRNHVINSSSFHSPARKNPLANMLEGYGTDASRTTPRAISPIISPRKTGAKLNDAPPSTPTPFFDKVVFTGRMTNTGSTEQSHLNPTTKKKGNTLSHFQQLIADAGQELDRKSASSSSNETPPRTPTKENGQVALTQGSPFGARLSPSKAIIQTQKKLKEKLSNAQAIDELGAQQINAQAFTATHNPNVELGQPSNKVQQRISKYSSEFEKPLKQICDILYLDDSNEDDILTFFNKWTKDLFNIRKLTTSLATIISARNPKSSLPPISIATVWQHFENALFCFTQETYPKDSQHFTDDLIDLCVDTIEQMQPANHDSNTEIVNLIENATDRNPKTRIDAIAEFRDILPLYYGGLDKLDHPTVLVKCEELIGLIYTLSCAIGREEIVRPKKQESQQEERQKATKILISFFFEHLDFSRHAPHSGDRTGPRLLAFTQGIIPFLESLEIMDLTATHLTSKYLISDYTISDVEISDSEMLFTSFVSLLESMVETKRTTPVKNNFRSLDSSPLKSRELRKKKLLDQASKFTKFVNYYKRKESGTLSDEHQMPYSDQIKALRINELNTFITKNVDSIIEAKQITIPQAKENEERAILSGFISVFIHELFNNQQRSIQYGLNLTDVRNFKNFIPVLGNTYLRVSESLSSDFLERSELIEQIVQKLEKQQRVEIENSRSYTNHVQTSAFNSSSGRHNNPASAVNSQRGVPYNQKPTIPLHPNQTQPSAFNSSSRRHNNPASTVNSQRGAPYNQKPTKTFNTLRDENHAQQPGASSGLKKSAGRQSNPMLIANPFQGTQSAARPKSPHHTMRHTSQTQQPYMNVQRNHSSGLTHDRQYPPYSYQQHQERNNPKNYGQHDRQNTLQTGSTRSQSNDKPAASFMHETSSSKIKKLSFRSPAKLNVHHDCPSLNLYGDGYIEQKKLERSTGDYVRPPRVAKGTISQILANQQEASGYRSNTHERHTTSLTMKNKVDIYNHSNNI